ncbi:RICIN domain-containing protein [Streptomyces triticiradicis]|uniref:Coagulation factor 5/8 type domain-containing protein n=1 Tax=Streptomyces triticiradicis TaxID=2651189 RepID=A0A7J5DP78_9ACTN|nr:RICIN domain-containing protein [Streptomyces triticiradicis]KAB1990580.1 coagulation factor 5/8 type domain-containing protein [Streptomyces triticiradicis]
MSRFPLPGSRRDPGRRRTAGLLTVTALVATTVSGLTAAPQSATAQNAAAPSDAAAQAAAVPAGWAAVVNAGSGKCVDARAAGTADGTAVQQYACNGSQAQQWRFTTTSGGYSQVGNRADSTKAWDVTDVSAADGAPVQLWTYGGGANQQWQAVAEAGGAYHFVNRNSGKCLDVPGASTADSTQLQQYTCNGTAAQSFYVNAADTQQPPGTPDLGPNVTVFDPSTPAATVQSSLDAAFSQQETNQFGTARKAFLFKPGTYDAKADVGFYTQVAGLGLSPDDVNIRGSVHAEADWFQGNATQNFWRSAENLSVTPTGGADRWAVSQAAPYRRMHLRGNLALDDGGWSSGGYMADTKIDGRVDSGSQQQWLSRNTEWGSWTGSNWNMVFVGARNAPANSFPSPPYTTVAQAPVTREKPFLYVDAAGAWKVFVPAVRTNTSGTTWSAGTPAGTSLPLSDFFVVKPGATAAQMNDALAQGKNLLVTPGVYHLDQTLKVNRADTVVLGLGLATLVPDNGITAVSVADVDGVRLAGLLIDAGTTNSAQLMEMGPSGSAADHSADPSSLHDVFFRIGGAGVGRATTSLTVNSDDVIGDHLWLWRADHGSGVGWTSNTADTGLVVNGDDVTMYGLFVEHYQKYQTVWNGNGGRTYFYQNEMPYDPPNQASWTNGSTQGYAAYKVANPVTSHQVYGFGSYCYFNVNPAVAAEHAIEAPNTANVRFKDMVTVSLGGTGTIRHVVNDRGGPSDSATNVANLVSYP